MAIPIHLFIWSSACSDTQLLSGVTGSLVVPLQTEELSLGTQTRLRLSLDLMARKPLHVIEIVSMLAERWKYVIVTGCSCCSWSSVVRPLPTVQL